MAAYALWRMRKPEDGAAAAEPELIACLSDADVKVREEAAFTFGRLGLKSKNAIAPLIECLKHDRAGLRARAATALGVIGPSSREAEPVLLNLARDDPEAYVRARAVEALSGINSESKEVVALAVALLKTDTDEWQTAFWVLGYLGPRASAANKDVEPFLDDKDEDKQAAAIGCLLLIGGDEKEVQKHVRRLLKESWARPIGQLLQSCIQAGARAKFLVPDLIDAHRQSKEQYIRGRIHEALKSIDPEALKKLDQ